MLSLIACALHLHAAQASAQSRPTTPASSVLIGHYEGTATNKAQQIIPITIELTDTNGSFSGNINSTVGNFPIIGGSRQAESVTIHFDANGETGTISVKLDNGRLTGTFTLGDDGGPVEATKTADASPNAATGKSSLANPILFLGVYHMANPGLDEVNTQADDVLSPKRQTEIEELVKRLSLFRPTKIAIEAPYRDTLWPSRYHDYLAGHYVLGTNEIEQIAFRLAKRLNLPTIYGVDFPMFMNGLTPSEIEYSKLSKTDSADLHKSETPPLSTEDELLRHSTVSQYLLHINSEPMIQKNHETYMTMLLPTTILRFTAGRTLSPTGTNETCASSPISIELPIQAKTASWSLSELAT